MAKSNPVGKNLVIVIVLLALGLIVIKSRDKSVDVKAAINAENTSALGENETFNDVTVQTGVDGDNMHDTLNTLTATINALSQEKKNDEENVVALKRNDEALKQELQSAKSEAIENKTRLEQLLDEVSSLRENLDKLSGNPAKRNLPSDAFISQGEYPIYNVSGNTQGELPQLSVPTINSPSNDSSEGVNFDDELVWISPIDATTTTDDNGLVSFTIPDISIGDTIRGTELYKEVADTDYGRSMNMQQSDETGMPYITIPRGGTGIDGVALTALIGRIPMGGSVVDAYRFKAIISTENLASNGIEIDGLSGAVVGGRVKGDYALTCVSGEIEYITFTFDDGTISTFPDASQGGSSEGSLLGYISDNAGVPCIAGKFISNGSSYLAQQVGLSSLNAGAQAYAQAATATTRVPDGATTIVDDANDFAFANMASEGITTASDWLTQRQQNSFDAVYVAPASRLTIHFESEISINYKPNGRKTNHEHYMQATEVGYDYVGLN